jgi:hypothetical protein
VLRPGGRLAVTTWAGAQDNMWLAAVGMSSMIHGIISGPMPTEPGGPLSLTDPEVLETLTRVAGFDDVSVEAVDIAFCTADVDEQLAHVTSLSPPIAAGFAAATIDQRAAVRASVAEMIAPFRTDDGYAIPGKALLLEAH